MLIKRKLRVFACSTALVWGALPTLAEDPLSAINWLSNTVATPVVALPKARDEAPVARSATVEEVVVRPLDAPSVDGVGLLPQWTTGFPADLWGQSDVNELRRLIAGLPLEQTQAAQALTRKLLLAELAPPQYASVPGALFRSRVDALLARGALDQAAALLDSAGALQGATPEPDLFVRAFDVALLTGNEDAGCETLRAAPGISLALPPRIFCLARTGDWPAAALTLETSKALAQITPLEDALLARFLDPELFEGEAPLEVVQPVSPLTFRMHAAIGEPIPTGTLPIAFAHGDLRSVVGWKARLAAGERLTRIGAISANKLLGLYSERKPSASGGVWERAAAVQALDRALNEGDIQQIGVSLGRAWRELGAVNLLSWLGETFGDRLADVPLLGEDGLLAYQVRLLSANYERAALDHAPRTERDQFLNAVAKGQMDDLAGYDPLSRAIKDGFENPRLPESLSNLSTQDHGGELLLHALHLLKSGQSGELKDLTSALALLRLMGVEDTARRASLELLLLAPQR